jgi:hypothetical protein
MHSLVATSTAQVTSHVASVYALDVQGRIGRRSALVSATTTNYYYCLRFGSSFVLQKLLADSYGSAAGCLVRQARIPCAS